MRNYASRPFAVGDEVTIVLSSMNRRTPAPDRTGKVVKLGRKWATLEVEGQYRYENFQIDIKTGQGKPERGFGSSYTGWHPEDREAYLKRRGYIDDIQAVIKSHSWTDNFSDTQLLHLAAILKRPEIGEWPK